MLKIISKEATKTSLGCLSKAWYSDGKDKYLIKGNMQFKDGTYGYEPYSEVIASIIADELGIPCIKYGLVESKDFKDVKSYGIKHLSICKEEKMEKGTQRISALQFMDIMHGNSVDTNYWRIFNRYNKDTVSFVKMLIFDAVIGNEDRHLNNWDMIVSRDGVKMAPLFDNGASLMAYVKDKDLSKDFIIGRDKSKPFKNTHTKQIALLRRTYPKFRLNLKKCDVENVLKNVDIRINPVLEVMPRYRAECISKYINNRVRHYIGLFID